MTCRRARRRILGEWQGIGRLIPHRAGWGASAALIASSYAILIILAVLPFFAATRFAQLIPEFSGALDTAAIGMAEV